MTKLQELIAKNKDNKAPVISYSELEAIVLDVARMAWDKCEITQTINVQDLNKVKKQFLKDLLK